MNPGSLRSSRMHSKGSRFTLGVGGFRVCSQDVARRPFATVGRCPYEIPMAMPAGSAAKVVTFECRFQMLHNFVSCGRRGTS